MSSAIISAIATSTPFTSPQQAIVNQNSFLNTNKTQVVKHIESSNENLFNEYMHAEFERNEFVEKTKSSVESIPHLKAKKHISAKNLTLD